MEKYSLSKSAISYVFMSVGYIRGYPLAHFRNSGLEQSDFIRRKSKISIRNRLPYVTRVKKTNLRKF